MSKLPYVAVQAIYLRVSVILRIEKIWQVIANDESKWHPSFDNHHKIIYFHVQTKFKMSDHAIMLIIC